MQQAAAAAAMLMGIIHQLPTPLLPLTLAQLCMDQVSLNWGCACRCFLG
jgi:hypothetical protein